MASVYAFTNEHVAHLAGVKKSVRAEGAEIKARAAALFAPHNHPGRHDITGEVQDTDYVVSLEGPAAVSVEYGRGPFTRSDGRTIGPMVGLHILGRAANL